MFTHRIFLSPWLFWTGASLLLIACQSSPSHNPTETPWPIPQQWTANPTLAPSNPNAWLNDFHDSQLSALVNQGLSANFDLKSAASRVEAAQQIAVIAGSSRKPQLGFTANYQRDKSANSSESGAFTPLFNFSWELDVWGRIKASQQAATSEADAVAEDYRAAQLSLAAAIAQSYFDLNQARLQAEVAEQSVKDRNTIVALVQGRFNKGLTRGLDLRLALTDRANAEAQLAQARNQVQWSSRQLQQLLGTYPDAALKPDPSLPSPPPTLKPGLPADLLQRRPDLIAAFKRLKASDARLESAEKALLPRITLTASGGTSSAALAELLDPRMAAWYLAAGLTQPIFTGNRLQAEIELNQARNQEALNQYYSCALTAFKEVEQALAAEAWLRQQELALREAVTQTEASRKLAIYAYRQGLIEILTLLDSYRSTLNAQSAHLTVQGQLLNNRINLYLALGGAV